MKVHTCTYMSHHNTETEVNRDRGGKETTYGHLIMCYTDAPQIGDFLETRYKYYSVHVLTTLSWQK
jgi:hypothetical protein